MRVIDLHWLAGLLEGEGSFCLNRQIYAVISIAMVDEDVIKRVANLLNVSVTETDITINQKIMYKAALTGRRAIPILHELRPLMSLRRRHQIDSILLVYSGRVIA